MKFISRPSTILFLLFSLFNSLNLSAQTNRKIFGTVVDSTRTTLSNSNILLVSGKDSLRTTTDKQGNFLFKGIKTSTFSINITNVGYLPYTREFNLAKEDKQLQLDTIILQVSGMMLKEVTVKGKINPVRVMTDTVEYNAAAYQVLEGDKVSDLLKQLPGVEVDDEDNATTLGKEMIKLRVNGKDFFTNNVKDFISKLPASIVAKIQVIDDYGDDAKFTGIKVGEPRKMLNIVTKDDINKGYFGNIGLNGGTSNQVSLNENLNIWRKEEQIGSNLNLNRADNGAGQNRNLNGSVNLRKSFGENNSLGINYSINTNYNDSENISFIETVNTLGTIFNENQSKGNNKGRYHNLGLDFQKSGKKDFMNATFGLGYGDNSGINSSSSKQQGIIKQDLINRSSSSGNSPNINGNFNWSRRLAKKGSNLSINMNLRAGLNKNDQNIISNTLYYDDLSGAMVKDSLLNRRINSSTNNNNFGASISYNYPLKKTKDSLITRSINSTYSFSIGNNNNDILTYVTDSLNNIRYVDSLSTQYSSLFFSQNIGTSYNYNSKKISYVLGATIRPNTLIGNYENLNVKIKNTNINYAPNFNFNYKLKPTRTLSMRYNGNSNSPSPNQLQPVRNTQNLQNVIVGNPNLKPSFNHSLSINYNTNDVKSGRSLQLSIGTSTTQNQIVSNVVLLRDTLNGLKQETRYENANGAYNINANYFYNIPLVKNKFTISARGNASYGNNIVFTDNIKSMNRAINLSQTFSSNLIFKKGSVTSGFTYGLNSNNYSLIKGNSRDVQTFSFNLSGRATVLKTYKVSTNLSKRINTGYTLANTNPFLIGATLNKTFLKSKTIMASLSVVDLLNQGNNLSRYVTGNTTIDSRSNQITRYFMLGISYNLQKFGGGNGNVVTYN